MTIGDLVAYLSLTALMTMPVIQLASIGTQMSEAFAGLDRIREIRKMATEDDEDESRQPLSNVRGELTFDDVSKRAVENLGLDPTASPHGCSMTCCCSAPSDRRSGWRRYSGRSARRWPAAAGSLAVPETG